jgi:hypothetical protein
MKIGFTIDKFILGPGLPGIDKVCYNLILELSRIEGVEVLLFQDKYKNVGEFGKFDVVRFPSLRDFPYARKQMGRGKVSGGKEIFEPPSALKLWIKDCFKRREIARSGIDVLHYPTHLERPYRLYGIASVMTFHDLVPFLFGDMCTTRVRWEMEESLIISSQILRTPKTIW